MEELQETIESRLHDFDPEVELILLERPAAESLRLVIDRPGGVDLALCERVTGLFRDLNERYSIEVSSPGTERPLTKPEHFRRFRGRRVRVRTREPIGGRRNFTGTLLAADERELALGGESNVTIPLAVVRRSNLVPEPHDAGGVRR